MKKVSLMCLFTLFLVCEFAAQENVSKLKFAFMTDIHLNYQNRGNCFGGFEQALQKVTKSSVDFVLLGGDCVDIDGLGTNINRADSLYGAFKNILTKSQLKVYPAIGNHDRYFDKNNGYTEGDELFKKYFEQSYYTFEQKGVRFFTLNSVQLGNEKGYYIGDKQMNWIKNELTGLSATTPIVVVVHVPVYSIYYPVVEGRYVFLDIIHNYQDLLKTFEGYNLQLVLQGHQHLYEEIFSREVRYITGGAISAGWWSGPFWGTKEGFLMVDIDNNNKFSWQYIDYGWKAVK